MEVQEAVSKVISSERNINCIVDLIEWTEAEDKAIAGQAIDGLGEVFKHLLQHHYDWCSPGSSINASKDHHEVEGLDPLTLKFMRWVGEKYTIVKERLIELLQDNSLQINAFKTIMLLIEYEGRGHQLSLPTNPYYFPNTLFLKLSDYILSTISSNSMVCNELLENYLGYEDVKYHLLQNIHAFLCSNHKRKNGDLSFVESIYKVLKPVTIVMAKTPPTSSDAYLCGDLNGSQHSLQKYRKVFSSCWLSFLSYKLSPSLHEEVLVSLHASVMPHMAKPHLLVDFLVGSYDEGGVKAILALNGLFILMQKYHLDYPHFYQNLYSLLDPSVMLSDYVMRFFRLMNIFLSSTHLPLYLVASFAKKIARLCLTAPPQAIMVGCVTVVNLIKRHPNCKVLLHRSNPEVLQVSCDPYVMEEPDPVKSGALESCLWELQVLQSHYDPSVSSLMAGLLNPEGFNKIQHSIEDYTNTTPVELIKSEIEGQQIDQKLPVNFTEPDNIWD